MMGGKGGPNFCYHWELLYGLGRKICTIKDWNICQTNVYGMLGVGTEKTKMALGYKQDHNGHILQKQQQ